ncbi:MAG: putative sensor protein histidine kinase [Herminiimonas sp.]|jgi:two-component system sensor histidine kinase TctE|nr:putative sensor protein histidine kinase [Herminiimonas sp.]
MLQRKLLAWLLGPLFAMLILDTLVTYSTSLNFSNLAYDRSLHEIAREVVLHVKPNGSGPRLDMSASAEKILLIDQDDRLYFKVTSEDGIVIGGTAAIRQPPSRGLVSGKPVFYDDVLGDMPVRVIAARMSFDENRPSAVVLVQVAETLNRRNRLARDILANVVVPQLLLIIFASAGVYFGIGRGLAPLRRLKRAVSDRSHLDLSPVDIRDVPGEVRPLVEEVNDLMLRLHKTLDFQNRFIADAAHQLKTPVAGIKAQIELALRENDLPKLQHAVAQLYISADRLSRLVVQLLSLARNEPGAVEMIELQPLDLNAFALDITMEWVPEALKRSIDLGFDGAGSVVMVDGDPQRLRELVNNLIDNAVRYSQDGGRVTVRVTGGEHGTLHISDDGPSIPVEERKRIFERFHRLLGTPTDGSGLGLAIVSEIAALHQARITLEEDVDGIGNTFTVFFPPSRYRI